MNMNGKSFIAGILVTAVIAGGVVSASAAYQKQATLDYTGIKITLDGQAITPKDANGNTVEPFAISGTTYLPVRAVADALGLEVQWEQATQTVALTSDGSSAQSSAKTTVGEGMYLVGKDIPAGTYKLTCTDSTWSAYWERSADASGELDSIIANDNFDTTAYVTVQNGEYLTLTRCTGSLQ